MVPKRKSRADEIDEKLTAYSIWEVALMESWDARYIKELTKALPFPNDVPRLKQIVLIKELSRLLSRSLDADKALMLLEALHYTFEDPEHQQEYSGDIVLSKRFKRSKPASPVTASARVRSLLDLPAAEKLVRDGLQQPTSDLKVELRKSLNANADAQISKDIESKLLELIQNAWALIGPSFLEEVHAALISGRYKPQGVSTFLPVAENNAGTPVAEENSGTPVAEEIAGTPVAEENAGTPVAEENAGTPVAEENAGTPVAEENAGTPVAEENAGTPVAENNAGTPVAEDNAGTPVAEDNAGTPVAEDNPDTMEDSGTKRRNQDERGLERQKDVNDRNQDMDRTRQELADSCAELKKVVKDPLPSFLRKPNAGGASGVVKRSLLESHPSAKAQVWDESDDDDDDFQYNPIHLTTSSPSKQVRLPHLHSPARPRCVSPLAMPAGMKLRRPKKKWSEEEVEVLKREVSRYGKGHWKLILQTNREELEGRTEVDLKDKWRNLEKYNRVY